MRRTCGNSEFPAIDSCRCLPRPREYPGIPELRAGVCAHVREDFEGAVVTLADGSIDLLTVSAYRRTMRKEHDAAHRSTWGFSHSTCARRALGEFVAQGRALLALHTAAICFDDWPEWREIVGGDCDSQQSSHPPLGAMAAHVRGGNHPIVASVADFTILDECDGFLDCAREVVPPATSSRDGADHPLLRARHFGHGRVLHDALGNDAGSYTHPTHAEILRRAARWLTGEAAHP